METTFMCVPFAFLQHIKHIIWQFAALIRCCCCCCCNAVECIWHYYEKETLLAWISLFVSSLLVILCLLFGGSRKNIGMVCITPLLHQVLFNQFRLQHFSFQSFLIFRIFVFVMFFMGLFAILLWHNTSGCCYYSYTHRTHSICAVFFSPISIEIVPFRIVLCAHMHSNASMRLTISLFTIN